MNAICGSPRYEQVKLYSIFDALPKKIAHTRFHPSDSWSHRIYDNTPLQHSAIGCYLELSSRVRTVYHNSIRLVYAADHFHPLISFQPGAPCTRKSPAQCPQGRYGHRTRRIPARQTWSATQAGLTLTVECHRRDYQKACLMRQSIGVY